jgi:hypothetical protein
MDHPYLVTVKNFIAAYNSFDLPGMMALVHPEIHFKNISNGMTTVHTTGKMEFQRLAENSAALFREREQQMIAYSIDENIVTIEIHYHAVLALEHPQGQHNNGTIDLSGKSEYIFKEGLIFSIVDES